jgi:deazaflavin-dependent oxidoreductase (nitroreductase family)
VPPAHTATSRRGKLRKELPKRLFNPIVKVGAAVGIGMPGVVILETTGRKSGKRRRTPVGGREENGTVWIVSEHGMGAGYVRNIEANPGVRVKRGLRWRAGTAYLIPDDDTEARLREMSKGHVGLRVNALGVRAMQTTPMTIRVELER